MLLENLVIDALDPRLLGRFWEAVLGCDTLTDEPGIFETRLTVDGGPWLDLCFQQVAEPASVHPRLHPDLAGGERQAAEVERLLGLGARHADIGQGDVPWVVLADPEGNFCCVMEERAEYAAAGSPLAALPLDSADPDRDVRFWAWLTGWTEVPGSAPRCLQHPSLRGPLLELCPESAPKGPTKNRLHLDVRLEAGEDADEVEAELVRRGGARLRTDWGELPWRSYTDPSGNELCVLPGSSA
jgi:hypothetical protein